MTANAQARMKGLFDFIYQAISCQGWSDNTRAISRTRLMVAAAIAVVVSPCCSNAADTYNDYVQAPYFLFLASTDETPRTVIANGHKFLIPRNYLLFLTMDHDKASFELVTFFPSFLGAHANDVTQYESRNRFKADNLIEVFRRPDLSSAYHCCIKHFIDDATTNQISNAGHGLMRIQYGKDTHHAVRRFEVFVHIAPNASDSSAETCDMTARGNYSTCTSNVDVAAGVTVEYRYPTYLLPHWQDIRFRLLALFKSFQEGPT